VWSRDDGDDRARRPHGAYGGHDWPARSNHFDALSFEALDERLDVDSVGILCRDDRIVNRQTGRKGVGYEMRAVEQGHRALVASRDCTAA
jgi:hypothetical protein